MLKDMGNKKKIKQIKCSGNRCKKFFDIHDGELIRKDGKRYILCPYCGAENKVK